MELICTGRNFYIIAKVPAALERISLEQSKICLQGVHEIELKDIYACLYCEELKNITFIVNGAEPYNAGLIFEEINEFTNVLNNLQVNYSDVLMSRQDKKINGYAAAILSKLKEGIETGIVDKKEQDSVKCCPVCGMECDPGIPYCMECGAEV